MSERGDERSAGSREGLSSTMRIDITPEALKSIDQSALKFNINKARHVAPTAQLRIPSRDGVASKYDQLLQSIYDGAVITDLEGQIVDTNLRAEEFFIYSAGELRQMNILNLVAGADDSLLGSLSQHLLTERFALLQAYCIRKDQTMFPAEIAVNLLKLPETRMCFFVRDVTLRKMTEEMLRTEHNALHNAVTGIAIVDVDGQINYVNPAVARMWGYTEPDQLVGQELGQLFLVEPDKPATQDMFRAVIVENKTWNGELVARRHDQSMFDVEVSAVCNLNNENEITGLVVSLMDVTDRKRAAAAIREAEQQTAMLASVGAACHHLGQPATVILNNIMLMKMRQPGADKEDLELMDAILSASERVAEILHKLNAVSEYRTVPYITRETEGESSRILDI